jgi:hypothetical protein
MTAWEEHARQASRKERRQAAALPDGVVGVDGWVRVRRIEARVATTSAAPLMNTEKNFKR